MWACTAAAEAEAAAAAAATDAEEVGGEPVWEGAKPVTFGAAGEGRRADRFGPQQGAPAYVSSAMNCIPLSSSEA